MADAIVRTRSSSATASSTRRPYYKRLVENGYGMSVNRFEEAYRRDLLRGKVVQAAIAGANVSEDEVKSA